ncbi:MAG TPA: cytochrome c [Candidatus Polarisedimenticolaceae bacterium]|nr:cytochrome c [Candidatus Polarisedimenticolaceae bacterium]
MFATKLAIFTFSQAKNVTPRIPFLASVLFLCCSNALADIEQGKRIYRENCAPCHGELGKGDGVGARSLPVHPADHTNAAVMNSRSDAFLRDVIAKGGKAMGLSSFMPAWQGIFKDKEIEDLVAYIRSLTLPAK